MGIQNPNTTPQTKEIPTSQQNNRNSNTDLYIKKPMLIAKILAQAYDISYSFTITNYFMQKSWFSLSNEFIMNPTQKTTFQHIYCHHHT